MGPALPRGDARADEEIILNTTPSKELETFPNPKMGRNYEIRFECDEFTCLCPRTGQPDFASITITYVPDKECLELE